MLHHQQRVVECECRILLSLLFYIGELLLESHSQFTGASKQKFERIYLEHGQGVMKISELFSIEEAVTAHSGAISIVPPKSAESSIVLSVFLRDIRPDGLKSNLIFAKPSKYKCCYDLWPFVFSLMEGELEMETWFGIA